MRSPFCSQRRTSPHSGVETADGQGDAHPAHRVFSFFQFDQQILGVDLACGLNVDGLDDRVTFGVDAGFHFHGFDGQQQITFLDLLTGL